MAQSWSWALSFLGKLGVLFLYYCVLMGPFVLLGLYLKGYPGKWGYYVGVGIFFFGLVGLTIRWAIRRGKQLKTEGPVEIVKILRDLFDLPL